MAMLPFIGYHVGDYLQQWIDIASKVEKLPAIFHVNWFRKDSDGGWLWPGFGQNMRVLEWILARADGKVAGEEKFVGTVPKFGELNLDGLEFSEENWNALMTLDPEEWKNELATQEEFLTKVGAKLPQEIKDERAALIERIG
jgi:phosphoenolpyruvate carboxykinase (GTP)